MSTAAASGAGTTIGLLYSQDSPNLHGSRGLSRGLIFRQDGTLIASVTQEGLVRLKRQT
ncbi:hypothetical protein AB0L20_32030 [Streptomyces albidoflavus]|uniref:hypothetical protein n=1 Tax=Streptomyces albidoflavus TaxID=1886 RepID=UPI00343D5DC1